MLSGINIDKKVNGTSILKEITIHIRPSTITCLIGPSGSGKSTILSCLSLLSQPTKGTIKVDNDEFLFHGKSEVYNNFPYPKVTAVFQGLFLWPHLTNKENILLPLQRLKKPLNQFETLVDRLRIRSILDKYPNECSGGEKQRVALARQILLEPKYLLLDEITAALDLEMVKEVADILLDLKRGGTGILLITHMINLAKNIADDFYFIDGGNLVEAGTVDLLRNPQTERLSKFLQFYV